MTRAACTHGDTRRPVTQGGGWNSGLYSDLTEGQHIRRGVTLRGGGGANSDGGGMRTGRRLERAGKAHAHFSGTRV